MASAGSSLKALIIGKIEEYNKTRKADNNEKNHNNYFFSFSNQIQIKTYRTSSPFQNGNNTILVRTPKKWKPAQFTILALLTLKILMQN